MNWIKIKISYFINGINLAFVMIIKNYFKFPNWVNLEIWKFEIIKISISSFVSESSTILRIIN